MLSMMQGKRKYKANRMSQNKFYFDCWIAELFIKRYEVDADSFYWVSEGVVTKIKLSSGCYHVTVIDKIQQNILKLNVEILCKKTQTNQIP